MIDNPFYLDFDNICNYELENLEYFYVLCRSDCDYIREDGFVYNKQITEMEYQILIENYTIIKLPINAANNSIKKGFIEIEKKILKKFCVIDYKLNDFEYIYPMFSEHHKNVNMWKKIFNKHDPYEIIEKIMFYKNNLLYNHGVNNKILCLLDKFDNEKYFNNPKNCNININNILKQKQFDIEKINKFKYLKNVSDNYDFSNTANEFKKLYKKYIIDYLNDENLGSIFEKLILHNILSKAEKNKLLHVLLSSKQYCHFILKNTKILEYIHTSKNNIILYNTNLEKYFSYAWIYMMIEEKKCYTKSNINDRYIFDLENANKLLFMNVSNISEQWSKTPYLFTNFSDSVSKKLYSHPLMKLPNENISSLVTLDEFKYRLNLFVCEKNVNLLEGLNWENVGLCGSCMSALIPRNNPILYSDNEILRQQNDDKKLILFFNKYYGDADIDIISNFDNNDDFINFKNHFEIVLKKNLSNEGMNNDLNTQCIKRIAIYINRNYINEISKKYKIHIDNLCEKNPKNTYAYHNIYIKLKNKQNNNLYYDNNIDNIDNDILKYCDIDNCALYFVDYVVNDNCESDYCFGDNENLYIKIRESMKYEIHNSNLKHPFQLFNVNNENIISTIGRFHLPCVRSYYDGKECHLYPSAISSYVTFINTEYEYFMGLKDPFFIINKYRRRGFSFILSNNELDQWKLYQKENKLSSSDNYLSNSYSARYPIYNSIFNVDGNLVVLNDWN